MMRNEKDIEESYLHCTTDIVTPYLNAHVHNGQNPKLLELRKAVLTASCLFAGLF